MDIEKYFDLQKDIAKRVIRKNELSGEIKLIAGADVAYDDSSNEMVGAIVTLHAKTLAVSEIATHKMDITFPYVSSLFSFREVPALIAAYDKLKIKPQLIICDGHGIAHPKEAGMASHLGVELNIPTIGCAKKRLIGEYEKENLGMEKGSLEKLIFGGKEIGVVLRTQDQVKPVFVSVGHKIDLETAVDWVLKLTPKFRLPETTREADQVVNKALKDNFTIHPPTDDTL